MSETRDAPKATYHHGNLRTALIEAGLAELESPGASEQQLSLRLLARQVGVTANAAYRHFADKDDLLSAMAAEGFRRFTASQREAMAQQSSPDERLRASGKAYIAFAQAHPVLFRMMFDRVATRLDHAELQATCVEGMAALMEASGEAAGGGGRLDPAQAVVNATACWAIVHGLSHLALGGQLAVFGMDTQQLIDRVMNLPSLVLSPQSP